MTEPTPEIPLTHGCVTEVFITKIRPENELAFKEWMRKIHSEESKFPGFRGAFVQSPQQSHSDHWITLLQFDTPENLERWLNSPERKRVLDEAKIIISSVESHRLVGPYAGWFSSDYQGADIPSVWKQTMLVLLVLFPIVMLELKFLSPYTRNLNSSLATFIGNAISVSLVSWPLIPISIYFLGWWLSPEPQHALRNNVWGTIVVVLLYFIEIALLWNLL